MILINIVKKTGNIQEFENIIFQHVLTKKQYNQAIQSFKRIIKVRC